MSLRVTASLLLSALLLAGATAVAQAPPPATSTYVIPYGPPVSVQVAKKAAAAAEQEAAKNHWNMAIAVVDPTGTPVYFEKMDNTQIGSYKIAINKARSAALYKRSTKVLEDALPQIGLKVLALPGAVPLEGGIPLMVDGKIIGAIGVSGDLAAHDGQCATAGANAVK
jgi:glc operon protein GlcG